MVVDRGTLCRVQPRLRLVPASQAGCQRSVGACVSSWGSDLLCVPQQPWESFLGTRAAWHTPCLWLPGGFGHGQDRARCWYPSFLCRAWEPGTSRRQIGRLCSIWPLWVSVSQACTRSSRGRFYWAPTSTTCLDGGLSPNYSGGAVAQRGGDHFPRGPSQLHPDNSVLGAGRG